MKYDLALTREPIDEARLTARRSVEPSAGAAVYFAGVVRGQEEGQTIGGIEYEAFEKMARRQFELIFGEAFRRWPVISVRLAHRLGLVRTGEASLWMEVTAPHRGEAFAAGQFIIDEMKARVPIWKKSVRNFS